eukprot:1357558-Amphidinium_carterae.2
MDGLGPDRKRPVMVMGMTLKGPQQVHVEQCVGHGLNDFTVVGTGVAVVSGESVECEGSPVQFGGSLKIVSYNALSLDNGRVCGLDHQASLSWLSNRLDCIGADIIGVQESRLSADLAGMIVGEFRFFSTASVNGLGGLLVVVRECSYLKCEIATSVSARVMVAKMRICDHPATFIVAHAPTRDAAPELHHDFLQSMRVALSGCQTCDWVIAAADLNTRTYGLWDEFPDVVGPQAISRCSLGAAHAKPLLGLLQTKKLALMNTFAALPTDTTWRHAKAPKTGSAARTNQGKAQLDYVMATPPCSRGLINTYVPEWEQMAGLTQSDHRPVVATIMLVSTKAVHSKRAARPQPLKTHEQRSAFAVALNSKLGTSLVAKEGRYMLCDSSGVLSHAQVGSEVRSNSGDVWSEDYNIEVQPEQLLESLFTTLTQCSQASRRSEVAPKKPWLKPSTLQQLLSLNSLRKAAAAVRQLSVERSNFIDATIAQDPVLWELLRAHMSGCVTEKDVHDAWISAFRGRVKQCAKAVKACGRFERTRKSGSTQKLAECLTCMVRGSPLTFTFI